MFFRDSLRRAAERAGVSGWVANRDDGAVEGLLEGEEAAVARLLDLVRSGLGHAEVDSLEVAEAEPDGRPGFRIVSAA